MGERHSVRGWTAFLLLVLTGRELGARSRSLNQRCTGSARLDSAVRSEWPSIVISCADQPSRLRWSAHQTSTMVSVSRNELSRPYGGRAPRECAGRRGRDRERHARRRSRGCRPAAAATRLGRARVRPCGLHPGLPGRGHRKRPARGRGGRHGREAAAERRRSARVGGAGDRKDGHSRHRATVRIGDRAQHRERKER
jgi:hypothetical protein